jgi:hypothetical protein
MDEGKRVHFPAPFMWPEADEYPVDIPRNLRPGAVAMIDALGFKGIWRPEDDAAGPKVLRTLGFAKQAARGQMIWHSMFNVTGGAPVFDVRFLSDTVVVTAMFDAHGAHGTPTQRQVVTGLAWVVAAIITQAAILDPPLAYRGCITAGKLLAEDAFFVGQAIDDAGDLMEAADAAVVWLAPSAESIFPDDQMTVEERSVLFRSDVPLKNGKAIAAQVVNPFAYATEESDYEALQHRLLATFERDRNRLDVTIKRQQTQRLLSRAREVRSELNGVMSLPEGHRVQIEAMKKQWDAVVRADKEARGSG